MASDDNPTCAALTHGMGFVSTVALPLMMDDIFTRVRAVPEVLGFSYQCRTQQLQNGYMQTIVQYIVVLRKKMRFLTALERVFTAAQAACSAYGITLEQESLLAPARHIMGKKECLKLLADHAPHRNPVLTAEMARGMSFQNGDSSSSSSSRVVSLDTTLPLPSPVAQPVADMSTPAHTASVHRTTSSSATTAATDWHGFLLTVKYHRTGTRTWRYDISTNDVNAPNLQTTVYHGKMPPVAQICQDVQAAAISIGLTVEVVCAPMLVKHSQPYHDRSVFLATYIKTSKKPTKDRIQSFISDLRSVLKPYPDINLDLRNFDENGDASRIVDADGLCIPWPVAKSGPDGWHYVVDMSPLSWPIDIAVPVCPSTRQQKQDQLVVLNDSMRDIDAMDMDI
jgi:hypothetical protein